MWLQSVGKDDLDRLVRESECCHMASGMDGEMFWASDAMCEWTGYTLNELQKIGWLKLSVDDDNLRADKDAAKEMKAGLRTSYRVEKKYRKKNGVEQWGVLHAKRVPTNGEFQYAWCHWTPFENGTQTAFSKAMEFQTILEKRVQDMTAEIRKLTEQTDDDKFILSSIRMVQRHPKVAVMIIFLMLSLFGVNNALEFLQHVGLIQQPVSVQVGK